MLDQSDVAQFLLDRGHITTRAIVDGDLTIRDASSRNRNFRVERTRGMSYLLKQGVGPEGVATVAHEALVYRTLSGLDPRVRRYVPAFQGYDPADRVLVIELIAGARDLRAHHLRSGRFSTAHARAMGVVLGTLHHLTRQTMHAPAPERAPWVLSAHRPRLNLFRDSSSASIQLVKILQQAPGFGVHLDRLRARWQSRCVIHQDVKWDNFLLVPRRDGRGWSGIKLIDWESAGQGEPGWDIGSLLSQYLSAWIFSIPITGQTPPERFPELASFPLERMQPALRACWDGYVSAAHLEPAAALAGLIEAVELAAARLILTAFEAAQMSLELTSNLVLHMQLAFNMLERPREASVHLLGIPARMAAQAAA